ncbi:lysylphosphatidylglycerol synthase transmembrane domain-containing protein [Streptomyces canus]|uniref:lysylphosphatidylglycerol synthase transmembrane domain-containing protein n=1 Tax=Streptomyces canus TaxID=58343 RepID=UPI003CF4D4D4
MNGVAGVRGTGGVVAVRAARSCVVVVGAGGADATGAGRDAGAVGGTDVPVPDPVPDPVPTPTPGGAGVAVSAAPNEVGAGVLAARSGLIGAEAGSGVPVDAVAGRTCPAASTEPIDVTSAEARSGAPSEERSEAAAPAARRARARRVLRAVRPHLGTLAGVSILAVLLWRMGTGVFLEGLRRIDVPTLLVALGIGAVTTVFSAWRWALVARGLRIRLPLGAAVADYYRSLFLNAALPGGILGDVHRAVRHGRSAGDVGRGVRAVVLERTAGQLALAVAGAAVLLVVPSPVMADVRHFAPLAALGAVGALAVVLAVRMNSPARRRGGRLRAALAEAREGLLSRRNGPGVALSSLVVLAGHIATFVVAARVAGSAASVVALLPLAVLALLAMSVPLNVGGWGPREGVTAWAFGAAGLGAQTGLAVAVVYGVLTLVAALPGAVVLVARWYAGLRGGAGEAGPRPGGPYTESPAAGPMAGDPDRAAVDPGPMAGDPDRAAVDPDRAAVDPGCAVGGSVDEVSKEKYVPKESARLARSSFPFSADPREGRPMTPESV